MNSATPGRPVAPNVALSSLGDASGDRFSNPFLLRITPAAGTSDSAVASLTTESLAEGLCPCHTGSTTC
jgi:hypothetical protein